MQEKKIKSSVFLNKNAWTGITNKTTVMHSEAKEGAQKPSGEEQAVQRTSTFIFPKVQGEGPRRPTGKQEQL